MSAKRNESSKTTPEKAPEKTPAKTPRTTPMKIDELASAAGVPVRTVRYYLARGVLPAPEFRGPHTVYGPEYLARLRAIQRLQEDYLPLDAIAAAVAGRSVDELERLAREGVGRRVLGGPPSSPAPARAAETAGWPPEELVAGGEVAESARVLYSHVDAPRVGATVGVTTAPRAVRALRWRLAPGVELVVDEDAPAAARRSAERWLRSLASLSELEGESGPEARAAKSPGGRAAGSPKRGSKKGSEKGAGKGRG